MPAVMEYIPPTDKRRTDYYTGFTNEKTTRAEKYRHALDYYNGIQKSHLDLKENEPDDNVVINVTQQAIDRTISFIFPAMPGFELNPDASEVTPDERWLNDAWEANGGISLCIDIAMFGALSGTSYLRIMPPDETVSGHEYPQLIPIDPSTITTFWRADDIRVVVWHEICWSVGKTQYILDFVNNAGAWLIIPWTNTTGGDQGWTRGLVEVWSVPGVPPIIYTKHLPNSGFFHGRGEAEFLELNDKLNLLASENNRIIRYHSSPKTVATGAQVDDIVPVAGSDEMWTVDNAQAKVYNLEMKSELAASRQQTDFLRAQYLSQARVVILEGQVKDFQRVTNAGVQTVFLDQLSKNAILRPNYGRLLLQASKIMLLMMARWQPTFKPNILWLNPLPQDDVERVNIAVAERGMNIASRETISKKRGYDWETEVQHLENESQMDIFQPAVQTKPVAPVQPTQN